MPNNATVELPELPQRRIAMPGGGGDMSAGLPLRGITILAVEDSRFASEALRLMCQRLGARLRRAESIHAAHAHLRLYRPNLVIVDLGLPDGRGEALIREIVLRPQAPIVLGMSGDGAGRTSALAAGAEGFLDKPLESMAAFQEALMRHLPERVLAPFEAEDALHPDMLALRDDLAHAVSMIEAGVTAETREYLTGFIRGVARHAHDQDLEAAMDDGAVLSDRIDSLRRLLDRRLEKSDPAFGAVAQGN